MTMKNALGGYKTISVDEWLYEVKLSDSVGNGVGGQDVVVKVVEADCV